MKAKTTLYIFLTLSAVRLFAADSKPNIIVILSDDQGLGDLSINGNTAIDTRNIDRLTRTWAQFGRFDVSPVCSPTRAEFLTDRHHTRHGVYHTSEGVKRVNSDETFRVGCRPKIVAEVRNGSLVELHGFT